MPKRPMWCRNGRARGHFQSNPSGYGDADVRQQQGLTRTVGANISDLKSIPPLLSHTDDLANACYMSRPDAMDLYDLQILHPPPKDLGAHTALFWSTGVTRKPQLEWLLTSIVESFREALDEAAARLAHREFLLPTII